MMSHQVKACCKVCKDAGFPESQYSSHWVKDKCGKVVCPYINSISCNYCIKYGNSTNARGHTPKYCKFLKEAESKKVKVITEAPRAVVNVASKKSSPSNIFMAFNDSDSEEEKSEVLVPREEKAEAYPNLPSKRITTVSFNVSISYASKVKAAAVMPESIPKASISTVVNFAEVDSPQQVSLKPISASVTDMSIVFNKNKYVKGKSWADDSDSD